MSYFCQPAFSRRFVRSMPDLLDLNDFLNGFRDGRRFQIQTSLKRTAQLLDDTSTLRPSRYFVYQTGILLDRHLLGKTGSIEDMRTLEDTVAVLKVSLMMLLVRSESFSGFFDCCKNVFCSRFCLDSWNIKWRFFIFLEVYRKHFPTSPFDIEAFVLPQSIVQLQKRSGCLGEFELGGG